MESINTDVQNVINEKNAELASLIVEREAEIVRINAAPKATRSVGKARYEPVDADSKEAAVISGKINAGAYTRTGIDFEVGHGVVRKIGSVKAEKVISTLGAIDKKINDCITGMKQAALAQKPTTRVRGAGTSGNHAITKAWFEVHSKDCPAGMAVAWNGQTSKIEYNLPKGGRGATVSHGALNNIVQAYGGKKSAVAQMLADQPLPTPAPAKSIPEKVTAPSKKKGGKK